MLTRKKTVIEGALLCGALLLLAAAAAAPAAARQKKKAGTAAAAEAASSAPAQPLLRRTTTRREVRRLGYGGALTIYGAPEGSITVEAWPQSEVDVTADIELQADTEEELARLAAVNSFMFDAELNRVRIITIGTHDRKYMKRVARDFPKKLLTLPWKIHYRIRVPAATDLEIYAGRGALNLAGVEGALRLNAGPTTARFSLRGGDVEATIERGPIDFRIDARSWRGRGASIRLASGDLTLELPAGFNADINMEVLRTGRIENTHAGVTAREDQAPASARSQRLRAGAGGATLSFTVGDGTLRIRQAP